MNWRKRCYRPFNMHPERFLRFISRNYPRCKRAYGQQCPFAFVSILSFLKRTKSLCDSTNRYSHFRCRRQIWGSGTVNCSQPVMSNCFFPSCGPLLSYFRDAPLPSSFFCLLFTVKRSIPVKRATCKSISFSPFVAEAPADSKMLSTQPKLRAPWSSSSF